MTDSERFQFNFILQKTSQSITFDSFLEISQ